MISLTIMADYYIGDESTTIRRNVKKIKLLYDHFPYDIMQDVDAKSLSDLDIGDYTKYLIGWSVNLDSKFHPFLSDKMINF